MATTIPPAPSAGTLAAAFARAQPKCLNAIIALENSLASQHDVLETATPPSKKRKMGCDVDDGCQDDVAMSPGSTATGSKEVICRIRTAAFLESA